MTNNIDNFEDLDIDHEKVEAKIREEDYNEINSEDYGPGITLSEQATYLETLPLAPYSGVIRLFLIKDVNTKEQKFCFVRRLDKGLDGLPFFAFYVAPQVIAYSHSKTCNYSDIKRMFPGDVEIFRFDAMRNKFTTFIEKTNE